MFFKKNTGYFIVIAVVILGLVSAVLTTAMLVNAAKTVEIQRRNITQQVHDVRMLLVRLYWSKPEAQAFSQWRSSRDVSEALALLDDLTTNTEVYERPLRLEVSFARESLAVGVAQELVDSSVVGSKVLLNIPESLSYLNRPFVIRKPQDEHQSVVVNSAVGMSSNNIELSDEVTASQLSTSEVVGSTASVMHSQSGDLMVERGYISQIEFRNMLSNFGNVEVSAIDKATVAVVDSEAVEAVRAEVQNIAVLQVDSEHVTANAVTTQQALIKSDVELRGNSESYFTEAFQRFEVLQHHITYCVEVSLWCSAPEAPKLRKVRCDGCILEQLDKDFTATLYMYIESCIHGCTLHATASNGAQVNCDTSAIQPHGEGGFICQVTHELISEGMYESEISITARNLKKPVISSHDLSNVEWKKLPEHKNQCEGYLHRQPIYNSVPQMFVTFNIPNTPLNEIHTNGVSGRECEMYDPTSRYNCIIRQQCGADGVWSALEASCSCQL